MIVKTKRFEAYYSLTFNQWTVTTDAFSIIVKTLRIKAREIFPTQKTQFQFIKATNVELNLIDSQVIILKYNNLEKKKLWNGTNPDMPRGLAKTVTVH